ncbi:hypothetical protein JRQ81_009761 [Phrynocephalus forsythii]|uniref:Small ribosomal subunit protein mS38 n=1 Tax=Phrynocephalus forsythii TaxID=171643 RepID=A0A9Q1ARR3_9SAUR|nr:hypothetical protein JRQ81_009761 [Phrynocephalus forsythii]
MLLSRLTLQIARASRFAECFLPRLVAPLLIPRPAVSPSYSTFPSSQNGPRSQLFHALEPELDDILVPRKMSITPLESWLTVQYGGATAPGLEPLSYELPPLFRSPEETEDGTEEPRGAPVECKKILKIRRRKMNKHRYQRRMKRTKFLRRKIKISRLKKKQAKFEAHMLEYARKFGLKDLPEGWVTPKLYFGSRKSD